MFPIIITHCKSVTLITASQSRNVIYCVLSTYYCYLIRLFSFHRVMIVHCLWCTYARARLSECVCVCVSVYTYLFDFCVRECLSISL